MDRRTFLKAAIAVPALAQAPGLASLPAPSRRSSPRARHVAHVRDHDASLGPRAGRRDAGVAADAVGQSGVSKAARRSVVGNAKVMSRSRRLLRRRQPYAEFAPGGAPRWWS